MQLLVRLAASALLAAALAVGFGAPAQAQGRGGIVSAIVVDGNIRVEPDTVKQYLKFREGDVFDPAAADASLKALFATGLFSDVTLIRDGGTVRIRLVENPIINRIAFEGNKKFEDDALRQEIQSRPRLVMTPARAQADAQRILELYRRAGRFSATVEPKVIQLEQNRVDLVFEIVEGSVTGIQRISFVGNERFSDGTLRDKIRTTESAWWRFLSSDDRYDPDRLNFDKELLRKFYLAEGYADFRILSAVAELSPDREGFFITFTLNEGERYKFGKIDLVTRFEQLNVDALRDLVITKEGQWYNADEVEESINALTDALGTLGYAFVDIRPNFVRSKEKLTVDISYEIAEGPRVYVERINVVGNVRTLDKVIRREFRLAEGDAFNTAKLRRTQQRLRNLGYFEKVEVTNQPGSAPDKTVVEVQVTEQSTGEISFGAGYSTSAGILGDITLRERNLLGKGQDVRLGLSLGTRSTQIDFSFTEPYFMDRNVSAGFDLFRSTRDNQDASSYDDERLGFALRAGYSLTEHTRQTWRYTFLRQRIDNVDPLASPTVLSQQGTTYLSEVGHVVTWDTRDNRFQATKGFVVRLGTDVAGLGGTEYYVRGRVDAAIYKQIFEDVVFSLSGSLGAMQGLGKEISLNNLFFVGGDNFRGFATGGLGPHDGGDAIGGRYMYIGSAETSFPMGFPKEFNLLGRAFVDAGSLFGSEQKSPTIRDSSMIRVSTGVGVSWSSPFGPIRIDYGVPLRKDKLDKEENFRFSFGTRF